MDRISRICRGLAEGFHIGAEGAARLPLEADNWSSFYRYGEQMCDAVQQWLLDGLVIGPLVRDQLPADIRVNPGSVELKPTGHARVCVDMSNPHIPKSQVNLWGSEPVAVNAGIDISHFPVNMVSTGSVLERCWMSGVGSFLAKQDWQDAYVCMFIIVPAS